MGNTFEAILDSGATINMINRKVLSILSLCPVEASTIRIRFANNYSNYLNSCVNVRVTFLGRTESLLFYVSDLLPCDILVGLAFIRTFEVIIEGHSDKIDIKLGQHEQFIYNIDIQQEVSLKGKLLRETCLDPRETKDLLVTAGDENIEGNFHVQVGHKSMRMFGLFSHQSIIYFEKGYGRINISTTLPLRVYLPTNLTIIDILAPVGDTSIAQQQIFLADTSKDKTERKEFNINQELSELDKNKLWELLNKNADLFVNELIELPGSEIVEHRIRLVPGSPVIFRRQYKLANVEKEAISQQIKQMVDANIIEPSTSPYCSPFLMIKKPNGTYRFVNDFRALNAVTIPDAYTLPRIDSILDSLSGSKFFSTMDMFSGFFQLKLAKQDRHKTSFWCHDGLFHFVRVPMGLRNSPSTFQRALDIALGDLRFKTCCVYVDDIVVFSKTIQEHCDRLENVFDKIRQANLRFSYTKSKFGYTQVTFLGIVVNENGFSPDPDKIKTVEAYKTPSTVTEVKSFLGLCNFFRQFVPRFADITRPLNLLLRKDCPFHWSESQEESFVQLKHALTTAPVLCHYSEDLPVILICDASGYGIGASLNHVIDGHEKPINYHSRTLNPHEQKYSITEREALAIIFGISKNRSYLIGRKFKIITDHHALCYLYSLRDPHGRVARWLLYLMNFDFEVEYRLGKANCVVDCLSRNPLPETIPSTQDTDLHDTPILLTIEEFKQEQQKDPFCQKISRLIDNKLARKCFQRKERLLVKEVFTDYGKRTLTLLPLSQVSIVLKDLHDNEMTGHQGTVKTYYRIHRRFYRPQLWRLVRKYVSTCDICQRRKHRNTLPAGIQSSLPIDTVPFRTICADYMGPVVKSSQGNQHIIVAIDIATRFCEAKAVRHQNAEVTIKFLTENIILRHGCPSVLITDRGTPFLNNAMTDFCNKMGIQQRATTAFHPQCNGIVENANKSLGVMLSILTRDKANQWDKFLLSAVFAKNTSLVESIGTSPFELLYGRKPRLAIDNVLSLPDDSSGIGHHVKVIKHLKDIAVRNIRFMQEKAMDNAADKMRHLELDIGDEVLLKRPVPPGVSKKFWFPLHGPYKVISRSKINPATYTIDYEGRPYTVNLLNLVPYRRREETQENKSNHEVMEKPLVAGESIKCIKSRDSEDLLDEEGGEKRAPWIPYEFTIIPSSSTSPLTFDHSESTRIRVQERSLDNNHSGDTGNTVNIHGQNVNQQVNRLGEMQEVAQEPNQAPIINQDNPDIPNDSNIGDTVDIEPYDIVDIDEIIAADEIVRIPSNILPVGTTLVPSINRLELPSGETSFRIEQNVEEQNSNVQQQEQSPSNETQGSSQYVTRVGRTIRPAKRFEPD